MESAHLTPELRWEGLIETWNSWQRDGQYLPVAFFHQLTVAWKGGTETLFVYVSSSRTSRSLTCCNIKQATQILRKCVYQSEIVRKGPRYGATFVSSAAPHSWNETIHVRWHTTLEDGTSPLTCIGCLMFDKKTSWDYPTTVPFISGLNKLADSVAKIYVKCHHIISFLATNHTKNRRNRIFSGKKMSRLF